MNIFDSIPSDLNSEVFESIIESKDVKIERIISKGHGSSDTDWYDQGKNEWVIVLKGEAEILFENEMPVTLKEGDYINIKAHQKHKVTWTVPESETIWLAIHY